MGLKRVRRHPPPDRSRRSRHAPSRFRCSRAPGQLPASWRRIGEALAWVRSVGSRPRSEDLRLPLGLHPLQPGPPTRSPPRLRLGQPSAPVRPGRWMAGSAATPPDPAPHRPVVRRLAEDAAVRWRPPACAPRGAVGRRRAGRSGARCAAQGEIAQFPLAPPSAGAREGSNLARQDRGHPAAGFQHTGGRAGRPRRPPTSRATPGDRARDAALPGLPLSAACPR
jgi:hypothetical protein